MLSLDFKPFDSGKQKTQKTKIASTNVKLELVVLNSAFIYDLNFFKLMASFLFSNPLDCSYQSVSWLT